MSDQHTVGTAMLQLVASQGIPAVFGLPGVHNLTFWSSDAPVRVVGVRHEQAAVYAADGYARATGRLGVAFSTTGPGAVNGVAAFGEACVSGSCVLLISSDVSSALRHPDGPRGILHEMADQAAPFAAFGVRALTASTGEQALEEVAGALSRAQSSPGQPTYLGVPSDILSAPWHGPLPSVSAQPQPRGADPDAVTALASLIRTSPRVVIWAGGGVTQSGDAGEQSVAQLAERLGAPVVTTYAGRGVMAGHPLIVETSVHEPEVGALIGGADLLLVVGSGFDAMNTKNWKMPMPERRAAIGLGDELARTIDWDVLAVGHLVPTLQALDASLGDVQREPWNDVRLREVIRSRVAADQRTAEAVEFVEAVETWPADGVIVTDMCIPGYWTSSHAVHPRRRRLINPVGWGTLGFALPAAIGPAAVGLRTLAVCGDGGPMFALGELATYVQERLPITLIVVDDGGYGMLRFDQKVFGHDNRGVDLVTPDWQLLAQSFGIPFTEVSDASGMRSALAESARCDGPSLILQRAEFYPPASTSPRWFEAIPGNTETA
ncbi:MAG: thiamine pyrophosphate-binding protein [Actinomycetota bacterium]